MCQVDLLEAPTIPAANVEASEQVEQEIQATSMEFTIFFTEN